MTDITIQDWVGHLVLVLKIISPFIGVSFLIMVLLSITKGRNLER